MMLTEADLVCQILQSNIFRIIRVNVFQSSIKTLYLRGVTEWSARQIRFR